MDGNSKRALRKSAKPVFSTFLLLLLLLLPPIIIIIIIINYLFIHLFI